MPEALHRSAALVTVSSLILLAGCQGNPQTVRPQERPDLPAYQRSFIEVFTRDFRAANQGRFEGSFVLEVTLNQQNETVGCKLVPERNKVIFPTPMKDTDSPALEKLALAQCWKSIYPLVPKKDFKGETAQIRAPIVLYARSAFDQLLSVPNYKVAQGDYLWSKVVSKHLPGGIGVALFTYEAHSNGTVTNCSTYLLPTRQRKDAFRVDQGIIEALDAECRSLNLIDLPGFSPGPGAVATEYAPWMYGRR